MTYIKAQEIIDSTKNWLKSYFQLGMTDESFLFEEIQSQLAEIGIKILPTREATLYVKNHKVSLPKDFNKLLYAISCDAYEVIINDPISMTSYEKRIYEIPACKTECDYCKDECGNLYQIYQRFDQHVFNIKNLSQLTLNRQSRDSCDKDCFMPRGDRYDIEIKHKTIHTNFKEGSIFLVYKSLMEEDGELLVPDDEYIKRFLRDWCIWAALYQMYLNTSDAGIERKMRAAKDEAYISKENARSYWKRSEVQDYYKLKTLLERRFNSMVGTDINGLTKQSKRFNPHGI